MSHVDELIQLIRERRNEQAMEMLAAAPELAIAHSSQAGQLHGASALHWAAHRNAVEVCRKLVELGADVNDSASDWWLTPLSWGADAGSADAVELLLQRGADVNQDSVVGTTALHAAAMGGSSQGRERPDEYERTIRILIAHGADVNGRRPAKRKQTPLDDAIAAGNHRIATILRGHGGLTSDNEPSPAEAAPPQ